MMPVYEKARGARFPTLGQETWGLGEDPGRRKAEVAALRPGFDLGLTLVDTAGTHHQAIQSMMRPVESTRMEVCRVRSDPL